MGAILLDSFSKKKLIILSVIGGAAVLLGILLGAFGPASLVKSQLTAYECEDGSHNWDPEICKGSPMNYGQPKTFYFEDISSLNRFFSLGANFFTTTKKTKDDDLTSITVDAHIKLSKSDNNDIWDSVYEVTKRIDVECVRVDTEKDIKGKCTFAYLFIDHSIRAKYYKAQVSFDVIEGELGDILFTQGLGNTSYGSYELSFNIVAVLSSAAMVLVWSLAVFAVLKTRLTVEQKLFTGFVITLFGFNNPMLSFKYIVGVQWFFNFIDSFLKDIFISYLTVFWIITIAVTLNEDIRTSLNPKKLFPKIAIVVVFFVIVTILHLWENIVLKIDPFIESMRAIGLVIFFVVVLALLLTAVIFWIIFDLGMNAPLLKESAFIKTRILFFCVPALVVLASQIISICCSAKFSIAKSSFHIGYFSILYNALGWIFLYGFFPVNLFRPDVVKDLTTTGNVFTPQHTVPDDDEETQSFLRTTTGKETTKLTEG